MIRNAIIATILAFAVPALAQQPDAADLQKAVMALQNQRNQATDMLVNYEIRIGKLVEENTKLKAEMEELKKKAEPAKSE